MPISFLEDEDLREGVRAAQDLGVRVTLIGVSTAGQGWNQSRELVYEADQLITLTKEELAPFIDCSSAANQTSELEGRQALHNQHGVEESLSLDERSIDSPDLMPAVQSSASKFAANWLDKASNEDVESVLKDRPRLPSPVDAALMRAVEQSVGNDFWEHESLRKAARGAFGLRVQQWASSQEGAEN